MSYMLLLHQVSLLVILRWESMLATLSSITALGSKVKNQGRTPDRKQTHSPQPLFTSRDELLDTLLSWKSLIQLAPQVEPEQHVNVA